MGGWPGLGALGERAGDGDCDRMRLRYEIADREGLA